MPISSPALTRDAAQLVPEYEMKRDVLETPRPAATTLPLWTVCLPLPDATAFRCAATPWSGITPIRPGCRRCWHARRDEKLMTGHIQTVLRRYPMASVDVVNEALAPPGEECAPTASGLRPGWMLSGRAISTWPSMPRARPIRRSAWSITTGASNRARPRMTVSAPARLRLLDGLLKRRVPIDALGMQGHLSAFGNRSTSASCAAFLERDSQARGLSYPDHRAGCGRHRRAFRHCRARPRGGR